jgi:hypothetical protein
MARNTVPARFPRATGRTRNPGARYSLRLVEGGGFTPGSCPPPSGSPHPVRRSKSLPAIS